MELSIQIKKYRTELHLSQEELAFYDALVADPEVLRNMEDNTLVEMAPI